MASTKCFWKLGSTAVSTFSILRTTCLISSLEFLSSNAILAPVPAAFPADVTWLISQSGINPKNHRILDVYMTPECTGQPNRIDCVHVHPVHQQFYTRIQRGFRQLYGPYVILCDQDFRVVFIQDIRKKSARLG